MNEPRFENEFIKYTFTESELKEIAGEMAQKIVNLQQAEDDKKGHYVRLQKPD